MTNWTQTREALIAAGVSAERLPTEWELRIDLTKADLYGADLYGANLFGADLYGADLRGASLRRADLYGADLRGANLTDSDLTNADLSGASGPFTTGYFGRHHAIAAGGYIAIGCERHTYDTWLERYEEIGREHCYSDDEIADYGEWIKLAVARQRRIEGIERE